LNILTEQLALPEQRFKAFPVEFPKRLSYDLLSVVLLSVPPSLRRRKT